MDCREARIAVEQGRGEEALVRDHVSTCADCRCALEAVESVNALLTPLASIHAEPPEHAVDALIRAISPPRRQLPLGALAVAATALLLLGGAAGYLLRGPSAADPEPRRYPAEVAEHERRVFAEARAALGEDLRWLATVDGEVVFGLSANGEARTHRVAFIEIRDSAGAVVSRTKLVIPGEEDVFVGGPGERRLRIRTDSDDRVLCALSFPDGAHVEASGMRSPVGETNLVGKVHTDGTILSVYLALH